MEIALREAMKGQLAGEVPVGAVITDDSGRVIATGHNSPVTGSDPTAHAEINVLRKAGRHLANYRLPGTTLYVTIEPCPMCAGALIHARVRRIVFGAHDPKAGACGSVMDLARDMRLNHRIEVVGGILEERCAEIIRGFFLKKRLSAGNRKNR